MKLFTNPLQEINEYCEARTMLSKQGVSVEFFGCSEGQKSQLIHGLSDMYDRIVVIASDELRGRAFAEDYRFFDRTTAVFPAKDLIFYQADVFSNRVTSERMKTIRGILSGEVKTVVTTVDAFMAPMVPFDIIKKNIVTIQKGSVIEEEALAYKLTEMGYERVAQVEEGGQFCVRGGIIDVFDLTEENPVRIELWGDEVDSIRSFDVLSQRSIEKKRTVTFYPARELILSDDTLKSGMKRIEKDVKIKEKEFRDTFKTEEAHRLSRQFSELKEQVEEFGVLVNLESYIRYFYPDASYLSDIFEGEKVGIFVDEPSKCDAYGKQIETEFKDSILHRSEKGYVLPGQIKLLQAEKKVWGTLAKFGVVSMSVLDLVKSPVKAERRFLLSVNTVPSYNGSVNELMRDLARFKKGGYRVLVISSSKSRAKRLAEDISEEGVNAFYSENQDRILEPGEVMTFHGNLRQGYEYPGIKFVVLSDTDIFGREKTKKPKKKYKGAKISDFTELKVGDYVVHESYGLGIYKGIEKITTDKVTKDYIKIEYAGDSNLYVLATAFDAVMKYSSSEGKTPKLNKLGTKEWEKTKTKVREAVSGIANELVELYAKRQQTSGYRYPADTPWQKEFEELFPYEETADQLAAIQATKEDMESGKIMERLVCGDVGFGKTEIAIRAAFKAVMEGKQVIYLVPTTILAQQHYTTFTERMKDYPVKIELMSRFRTAKAQKKTAEALKKGTVDIVIGTHRVLSNDVEPKDLGLLIIDEEQRFGVSHKEKIKKLKENVDVLTLTATPIPRTLHMSLIGIRDLSLLEEAPRDRMPIQTFVCEYDEETVREAIVRELARGGQVYYVYNRVQGIEDVTVKLQNVVPEARIAFAHGQMSETELEDRMYDFINGETDVLVSTTIIETGLDIPNVNTIIIADSDRLGLSQLYQLRGRVGRSNRNAYAFLMYKRDKILKEEAEKRLKAIREFTDLGSGFRISMRDLEIRGAGNILGFRQHGHMEAVGYELYCKMLNEAVAGLKGEKVRETFETTIELEADAFIPEEYIVNEEQKLDMYHKIASIDGKIDCDEMRDELTDRFGTLPKAAENLLRIALIKAGAKRCFVTEIRGSYGEIKISVKNDAPVKTELVPDFLESYKGKMRFVRTGVPGFVYKYEPFGLAEKDEEVLLSNCEQIISHMEMLFDRDDENNKGNGKGRND